MKSEVLLAKIKEEDNLRLLAEDITVVGTPTGITLKITIGEKTTLDLILPRSIAFDLSRLLSLDITHHEQVTGQKVSSFAALHDAYTTQKEKDSKFMKEIESPSNS